MDINKKTIRGWLKKIIKPLLIIIILLGVVYWFKFSPMPVETYKVERGNVASVVMGTGTLDAKVKMIISSKISGRLENIMTDQGDKVSKKQLLTTLDDDQLNLQVEVAQANLITVESSVKKLQANLEYSQAVLDNAVIFFNRYKTLVSKNVVSQEKFDSATEELGTANAKYSSAKEAMVEAQNKVFEAQKVLKLRKSQLDDTQIKAPFDGIITQRERDPGDIVIPGSAILSLISTNVLWVSAWVGETELAKVKVGQPVKIIFRSEPKRMFPGKVARIANKVDRETREFIVDATVKELPVNWAIGQRAEVYIETGNKNNVLLVPEKYIKWQNNISGVFVDNGGYSSWHPIKTGLQGNGFVEIINGVQAGDKVLNSINIKDRLTNSTRIYVK